jgi:bifunctional non-homologous end joining protein LigD
MAKRTISEIKVAGKTLQLSNLEKVFYPATGFTKGDMIDYYIRVSPALLPHLKDRTITLKRYPNGVDGMFFYEKRCPAHRPDWIKTASVWSEGNKDHINFCVFNDLPSLVWAANIAVLEMHTYLARAKAVLKPTTVAFDLDPGAPADIIDCAQVGIWIRDVLDHYGLQAFPKTSGSKGLQLYIPLNTSATYDDTKGFARALAEMLQAQHPKNVTSIMRKDLRKGKVFIDWSQNDDHKTTVSVYSLRAKERPTVSTPVTWDEVERALKKRVPKLLTFESHEVLARIEKHGDLFAPVQTIKQKLPRELREAA